MKTLTLFLVICFTQFINASSYEEAMQQNIKQLFETKHVNDFNSIAAHFKRIASAETDKWLPSYYAAYTYARSTYFISNADSIDMQLDKAQAELDALLKRQDKESEIHVLQGFVYSLRITSPVRGYKYSSLSNASLAKAEELNPDNPRVHYGKGNNIYYTPKMFGGGPHKAKPHYEKAARLFNLPVKNVLWPSWGKQHNSQMLGKCVETN